MKHSIINNDFVKALFSAQEKNISQPHIFWSEEIFHLEIVRFVVSTMYVLNKGL